MMEHPKKQYMPIKSKFLEVCNKQNHLRIIVE